MKTNTFFGLAFLHYSWELSHKDLLDSYTPLVCECILQMSLDTVNRDDLKKSLNQTYGINLDLGVIETILKKCVSKRILYREAGEYHINIIELQKNIKQANRDDIAEMYDQIVENIVEFAKKQFKVVFRNEEIEKGLLAFLKEYDTDIVMSTACVDDIFININETKRLKYIISKYIIHTKDHKKGDFKKILDIAKGHSIASLITLSNINAYVGQLNKVDIYLDAPIIFNIMGVNGEPNNTLSTELIKSLKDKGAKIKVFKINEEEVISTVTDAIERLTTKDYVLYKSSRILRTAVRESYTPSRLRTKLEQLPKLFEKYDIEIVDAPAFDPKFSIDEKKLTELIEKYYLARGSRSRLNHKQKESIERDVQTISYIYQIRGSENPQTLKQSKAILLTSNQAIAFCSNNHSISNYGHQSKIAPSETDLFLSTILWANYPSKNEDIKMKQLMTVCYNNIELDDKIFQKFYQDICRLHEEQTITEEQFYLLNASNLTYKLLEKRTLNDIDEYTDKTPQEIVEDLMNTLQHGEIVITNNVKVLSVGVAKLLFWLIWALLFVAIFFVNKLLPKIPIKSVALNWGLTIIAGLLGGFGLFRWIGIIPSKSKIVECFCNKIYNGIMKILRNERME